MTSINRDIVSRNRDIMYRISLIAIMPGAFIRKYDFISCDDGSARYSIIIWEHGEWWDMFAFDDDYFDVKNPYRRDSVFNFLCNGTSVMIGWKTLMTSAGSYGSLSPASIMDYRVGEIIGGCDDEREDGYDA